MERKIIHTLWDRNPSLSCKCYKCKYMIDMFKACTCKAFPTDDNNIPDDIIHNLREHNHPIDGQVGDYVFAPNQVFYVLRVEKDREGKLNKGELYKRRIHNYIKHVYCVVSGVMRIYKFDVK